MRSMETTEPSATMGKDVIHEASMMMVKVDDGQRPSTTTATGATAASGGAKGNSKNAFRFARFSIKSPSMGSTASSSTNTIHHSNSNITPRTSRRLRRFPLLRLRSLPVDVSHDAHISPTNNGAPTSPASSNSSTTSSSTDSSKQRQQQRTTEAREGHVVRCTKIYSVQNTKASSSGELYVDAHDYHHDVPPAQYSPEQAQQAMPAHKSPSNDHNPDMEGHRQQPQQETTNAPAAPTYSCSSIDILQHSYLEMVCGRPGYSLQDEGPRTPSPSKRRIPDDPTVQDSIECVFASQLEDGLQLWSDDDDDDEDYEDDDDEAYEHRDEQEHSPLANVYEDEPVNAPSEEELPSPAPLMQSRQKSRKPLPAVAKALIPIKRRTSPRKSRNNGRDNAGKEKEGAPPTSPRRRKKKYQTAKMVHVGTFDPRTNRILEVAETDQNLMEEDPCVRVAPVHTPPRHSDTTGSCLCHSHSVPLVPDAYWPQAPLLLRPTPNQGVSVKGVRFSGKTEPFWRPCDGGWWLTPLYEQAGREAPTLPEDVPSMCSQCCLLPINNGNEPLGEALVTDFETPLFEGTLLVRLRYVHGNATNTDPAAAEYDDDVGYFAGLNRRYQVVIRGKFKTEVPFTNLVAGSVMDRPYGRLPPKWIMKGAIKVLSFFAPQLEVELEAPRPKTMAPLGSTPQALRMEEVGPHDTLPPLDSVVEEPRNAKNTLLGTAYSGSSSLHRARGRKKAFDKLFSTKSRYPLTKTSEGGKETFYTFEFLQHLVNFQDFSIELGNLLGSIPIAPILSGTPIPIMAMVKEGEQKVWSFDLWHKSLVEEAKAYDAEKLAQRGK